MLCSICQNKEATVHLTQIADEKMQKVDLCEACAKEKGVNDPAGFSLADMLLGLGASQELEESGGEGGGRQCPNCGFTQADFKKTGRLGCPDCYTTFAEGMEGLLKTMHKGVRHVGKSPAALRKSRDLNNKLKRLQRELDKSVAEENFEKAAVLRDEIKDLKHELEERANA